MRLTEASDQENWLERFPETRELTQPFQSIGTPMTSFAVIIKHQTQPGKRDAVQKVWETHMAPAIAANPGHLAYFYCFDNSRSGFDLCIPAIHQRRCCPGTS
jgi:hypothetical protein